MNTHDDEARVRAMQDERDGDTLMDETHIRNRMA